MFEVTQEATKVIKDHFEGQEEPSPIRIVLSQG